MSTNLAENEIKDEIESSTMSGPESTEAAAPATDAVSAPAIEQPVAAPAQAEAKAEPPAPESGRGYHALGSSQVQRTADEVAEFW